MREQRGLLSTTRPADHTNWNHTLVSGFTQERRLLHPMTALRPSTNELVANWDKNMISLNFPTKYKTCKDHFSKSLAKSSETQIQQKDL